MTIWRVDHGDCLELLRAMPDASVDCVVTSPPYDKIRNYGNNWTLDLPEVGRSLFRVCKDGAVAAVVIQDGTENGAKTGTTARTTCAWLDAGWRLWETCIWNRPGTPGAWWNKRFRVDHEFILLFVKGERPAHFDKEHLRVATKHAGEMPGGSTTRTSDGRLVGYKQEPIASTKCRGTVWSNLKSCYERDPLKSQHPATFPQTLASDLLRCFSDVGETVLDPFTGSGSTGVEALLAGRNFIGCEIDPGYVEIARRRIGEAVARKQAEEDDGN